MKFATAFCVFIGSAISLVSSVTVPGASTPLFYLVSSSSNSSVNLLPLQTNGGTGGYSTLSGSGPVGQFYFYQGVLTALSPTGSGPTTQALIGAIPISSGCSTYGPLGFAQLGGDTDKCATYNTFQIQSDTENSQLGAALVFNYVGGFYACGSDVWYKVSSGDGPTGCSAISLYTVPVLPVP